MGSTHISRVGAGISSLQSLALELRGTHVQSLCLHANSISRLESLRMLQGLKDLNLSSNQLREIEGLQTLTSLTSLNLASNRLSSLEKLRPLSGLESLNASHNTIDHLSCLSGLQVTYLNVCLLISHSTTMRYNKAVIAPMSHTPAFLWIVPWLQQCPQRNRPW